VSEYKGERCVVSSRATMEESYGSELCALRDALCLARNLARQASAEPLQVLVQGDDQASADTMLCVYAQGFLLTVCCRR